MRDGLIMIGKENSNIKKQFSESSASRGQLAGFFKQWFDANKSWFDDFDIDGTRIESATNSATAFDSNKFLNTGVLNYTKLKNAFAIQKGFKHSEYALAWVLLHVLGHNAGEDHNENNKSLSIMTTGSILKWGFTSSEIFNGNNDKWKQSIQSHFGSE